MKVKKLVILAAGLGTRFLPITKGVSKEMLPLVDEPIIHKLVKEGADPNKTEKEIMKEKGYTRIWDCGTLKFKYKKEE